MHVALVGFAMPSLPSRGLDVLAEALGSAGHRVDRVAFGGFPEVERVAAHLFETAPPLAAIALPTIESALATVVLVRRLRSVGYRGFVVLGGHFATLNAEALVQANPGIDAVVRLAGEEALVGLASLPLAAGSRTLRWDVRALSSLPGLVFVDATGRVRVGAPARPLSANGASISGARHLGFVAADVVASQGCEAHCAYCCIPAAADLAVSEARRGGSSTPASARYARLSADGLADSLVQLYRERGVRVVSLMDDNVLPSSPEGAAAFARAVTRRLEAAGVPKLAVSLQLRADVVDAECADALVALGVVRAYVGIDGYSDAQLRVLGRASEEGAGQRALDLLHQRGVFSVVNALLVGPTVPFEVLAGEIDALARLRHAPVHLLPHEVRAGTPLFRRAQKKGLVEGGYLHWHYRFADPRTGRVARLLTSLPTRLAERSVPIALYDLAYNTGTARRLCAATASDVEGPLDEAQRTFDEVTALWNADQVRVLRESLRCAEEGDAAVDAWLKANQRSIAETDRAWRGACDRALCVIEQHVARARGGPVSSYQRGRLLGAVAFAMSVAACNAPPVTDGGTEDAPAADVPSDTASVDAPLGDGGCASSDVAMQLPCGSSYQLSFDADGRVSDVVLDEDGGTLSSEMRAAILASFAPFCYPSLAGTSERYTGHCWIA